MLHTVKCIRGRMVNIQPLGARVAVRRVDPEQVTTGGVFLPDAYLKNRQEAIVVALGTGSRTSKGTRLPTCLAVGDRVVFGSPAGLDLEIRGEEFLILLESAILGTVAPNKLDIIPIWDRLILEVPEPPYAGKVILPLAVRKAMHTVIECTVVAAGNGHWTDDGDWVPQNIQVGQKIWVMRGHITKFHVGNKVYHATTRAYVLAVTDE